MGGRNTTHAQVDAHTHKPTHTYTGALSLKSHTRAAIHSLLCESETCAGRYCGYTVAVLSLTRKQYINAYL